MTVERKRVLLERFAKADFGEMVDFFATRSDQVALRFIDAAEETFEQLGQNPESAGLWNFEKPEFEGIRVRPIVGFRNYLIFYRVTSDAVQILRILYGGRDLGPLLAEAVE